MELPAATGSYYLSWPTSVSEDGIPEVTLHAQGNSQPILTIPGVVPPAPPRDMQVTDPLFSRRLLYVPFVDAVVTLGGGMDTIVIQRFSLDEALAKTSDDYLFVASTPPHEVRPATRLSYQIDVKSKKGGVKYQLTAGPEGAAVSPGGLLTWTIANSVSGPNAFAVRITNDSGKETMHTFNINVEKEAPQLKPSTLLAGATPKSTGAASPVGAATVEPSAVAMAEPAVVETVDLGRPRKEIKLPGLVERLCVGGGGRYLVGFIKSLRQVVVIDVVEKKLLKLVPVDDDNVLLAAGATKFVVWMGNKAIFSRYDLATCARELTVAGSAVKLRSIAMGCASEGPLFGAAFGDFGPPPVIYDLKTLKPSSLEFENNNQHFEFSSDLGVSADGRFFVAGGAQCQVLDKKIQILGNGGIHRSSAFGLPSSDGRLVYGGDGSLWPVGGNRIYNQQQQHSIALPAAVGSLYARLPTSESRRSSPYATLHVQGETSPILTLEEIDLPQMTGGDSSGRMPQKVGSERFFLLPTSDAVVTVADTADSLTIYRFNLDEELKRTEIDYLFVASVAPSTVHPSASIQYQLDVRSKRGGVKFRLEAGPPGMAVSPTGLLTWQAKGPTGEEQVVIVAVSDASGQELFHTFKFKVDSAAPNSPAVGVSGPKSNIEAAPAVAAPPAVAVASLPPASAAPDSPPVAEPASATTVEQVPGERSTHALKLPAAFDDVVVGGGGRYLVVRLKSLRQAAIVDVREKKVVKYLPVDDDQFYIAAGNTKLVIVSGSKNVVSRYDLATGARELTAAYSGKSVQSVAMGSSSEGPVLLAVVGMHDSNCVFLDLQSLKPADLANSTAPGGRRQEIGNVVRASADGTLFGSWRTSTSPNGLYLTAVTGKTVTYRYEHESVGMVLPSPDARIVYTNSGMHTPEGKPIDATRQRRQGEVMLPAASGPFYLNLSVPSMFHGNRNEPPKLSLHMQGETSPILTLTDVELPTVPADMHPAHMPHLGFEKRMLLLPVAEALVCVPQTMDQLVIQRFSLDEELAKSEVDFLFVASVPPAVIKAGDAFQYQVAGKSKRGGTKYRLESGPAGMAVSPTGLVTWKASRQNDAEEVVIIALSDGSGQEIFHTFRIKVETGGSASPPPVAVTNAPPIPAPAPMSTAPRPTPTPTSGAAKLPSPTATGVPAGSRMWKSSDGIFSIEAKLVKVSLGKVTLLRADGQTIEVPVDKLSAEDQAYLKQQGAR
ncbi:MAG: SHD1 domain-containing protein [Pirellulales bacterium]